MADIDNDNDLKQAESDIISTEKEVSSVTDLAESAVDSLTSAVTEPIKLVESTLKTVGTSFSTVKDLVTGGLDNVDGTVLGLASSVVPMDNLKNVPLLQLKSLALNSSPKVKKNHGVIGNIVDNVRESLNISMEDIVGSDVFKDKLESLGIDSSLVESMDLTDISDIDSLKDAIAEKTGISNIGESFNDILGTPETLINNFSSDKIKKKALSLVTNSGAENSMDILKRFIS